MRAKEGQRVSGDAWAHFETAEGRLCLLLSDGMGSGESAHREAAMAVRLLERFLKAGIEPAVALKTLSGALALKGVGPYIYFSLPLYNHKGFDLGHT